MPAATPRVREDLAFRDVDGEIVVYDPVARIVHHLNPVAGLVFQLLDGTATIEQTSDELAEAYGQPETEVERHVREIVVEFEDAGLLAKEPVAVASAADEADARVRIRMEVPRSD